MTEDEELIAHLRESYRNRGLEVFNTIIEGFAWRSNPPTRHIVAVATRVFDAVYQLPPPARHHNLIYLIPRPLRNVETEEGFITSDGTFVSRQEALAIAREAGQITRRCGSDERYLTSEGLW